MLYKHGDVVTVDLDLNLKWVENKLRHNHKQVTIDKFNGWWDDNNGRVRDEYRRGYVESYKIIEDSGEFCWTPDHFAHDADLAEMLL